MVRRAPRAHRTSVPGDRTVLRRGSRILRLLAAVRDGAVLLGDDPAPRRDRRRDSPLRPHAQPSVDARRALRLGVRASPFHDARRDAAARPRVELSAGDVSPARRGERRRWHVHVGRSARDRAGDARAGARHTVRRGDRALGGMDRPDASRLLLRERGAAAVARRAHGRAAGGAPVGRSRPRCDREAGAPLSGDPAELHPTRLRRRRADARRIARRWFPDDDRRERTRHCLGREHASPLRRRYACLQRELVGKLCR